MLEAHQYQTSGCIRFFNGKCNLEEVKETDLDDLVYVPVQKKMFER
jgi:hypothetical protein